MKKDSLYNSLNNDLFIHELKERKTRLYKEYKRRQYKELAEGIFATLLLVVCLYGVMIITK